MKRRESVCKVCAHRLHHATPTDLRKSLQRHHKMPRHSYSSGTKILKEDHLEFYHSLLKYRFPFCKMGNILVRESRKKLGGFGKIVSETKEKGKIVEKPLITRQPPSPSSLPPTHAPFLEHANIQVVLY